MLGLDKETSLSVCLVEVETDTGLVGHGHDRDHRGRGRRRGDRRDRRARRSSARIRSRHERIWDKLYWLLSPRGQTGYASHAIAAIDVALWDLKGKHLRPAGLAPARRRA